MAKRIKGRPDGERRALPVPVTSALKMRKMQMSLKDTRSVLRARSDASSHTFGDVDVKELARSGQPLGQFANGNKAANPRINGGYRLGCSPSAFWRFPVRTAPKQHAQTCYRENSVPTPVRPLREPHKL